MQDPRVAFSSLQIHNLSASTGIPLGSKSQGPIAFPRKQPPDFPSTIIVGAPKVTRELPQRRPSLLSSPSMASINLEIAVGTMLAAGGHGIVHNVEVLTHEFYETMGLPDLVMKIAYQEDYLPYLSREAFLYEEMECLQGVCIARCYGYFEAVLTDSQTISILLLEKLGPELSKPELLEKMPEVAKMYREFWSLGIEHADIKRVNMLTAPGGPRQLPNLPSPLWGDKYSLRIIDFGISRKSNFTFESLEDSDLHFLEYLKESIEDSDYDGTVDD